MKRRASSIRPQNSRAQLRRAARFQRLFPSRGSLDAGAVRHAARRIAAWFFRGGGVSAGGRSVHAPRLGLSSLARMEPLEERRLLAVLTVNTLADNTTDDADLTLREATLLVNHGGNASAAFGRSLSPGESAQINTSDSFGTNDTIDFDSSLAGGTIMLTGGLQLSLPVTIQGLGADQLTIDGNNGTIFGLDGANGDKTFTINDLTLTGAVNTVNMSGSNLNDVLNINRVVARDNADSNSAGSRVLWL